MGRKDCPPFIKMLGILLKVGENLEGPKAFIVSDLLKGVLQEASLIKNSILN